MAQHFEARPRTASALEPLPPPVAKRPSQQPRADSRSDDDAHGLPPEPSLVAPQANSAAEPNGPHFVVYSGAAAAAATAAAGTSSHLEYPNGHEQGTPGDSVASTDEWADGSNRPLSSRLYGDAPPAQPTAGRTSIVRHKPRQSVFQRFFGKSQPEGMEAQTWFGDYQQAWEIQTRYQIVTGNVGRPCLTPSTAADASDKWRLPAPMPRTLVPSTDFAINGLRVKRGEDVSSRPWESSTADAYNLQLHGTDPTEEQPAQQTRPPPLITALSDSTVADGQSSAPLGPPPTAGRAPTPTHTHAGSDRLADMLSLCDFNGLQGATRAVDLQKLAHPSRAILRQGLVLQFSK